MNEKYNMFYQDKFSDKRDIEEVLNIFDNLDNEQVPNLMIILIRI
jgi:hypothetical protein